MEYWKTCIFCCYVDGELLWMLMVNLCPEIIVSADNILKAKEYIMVIFLLDHRDWWIISWQGSKNSVIFRETGKIERNCWIGYLQLLNYFIRTPSPAYITKGQEDIYCLYVQGLK
jgi:hypothetical protein